MAKHREYSRELSPEQLEELKNRYSEHLKSSHGGFLSDKQRKRLLGLKKKEEGTPDSDFWWRIKGSTRDAIMDMKLICDIASEKELQEIFGTKNSKQSKDVYPITEVLSSLLPSTISIETTRKFIEDMENQIASAKIDQENNKHRPDEVKRLTDWINANEPRIPIMKRELPRQEEKIRAQKWRKFILEDVTLKALKWYLNSGLFMTDAHQRLIIDLMDAITISSSGKKKFYRTGLARSEIGYFPSDFLNH